MPCGCKGGAPQLTPEQIAERDRLIAERTEQRMAAQRERRERVLAARAAQLQARSG